MDTQDRYNIRMIFRTAHTLREFTHENQAIKGFCNRQHSVATPFPVNVAEATLGKQADKWPCDSMNIGMGSESFRKIDTSPTV
jgi:hypothetical protein